MKPTSVSVNVKVKGKRKSPGRASGIAIHCAHSRLVPLASLKPNPRNPNHHDKRQIDLLAKVIKHQGWRSPITVSNRSGYIVTGHGRYMAAQALGVSEVPADFQDFATDSDELLVLAVNALHEQPKETREYRRRGTEKKCPSCRLPFYAHPCELSRVFCSPACKQFGLTKNPWRSFDCQQCGKAFSAQVKPYSNNSNHFCSLDCRNLFYRTLTGHKSHSWRGIGNRNQRARHTKTQVRWRAAIFKRDDYTCQRCGERGGVIHAHHIKPFATHPELRAVLSNGITICKPCHDAIHGRNFRVDLHAN